MGHGEPALIGFVGHGDEIERMHAMILHPDDIGVLDLVVPAVMAIVQQGQKVASGSQGVRGHKRLERRVGEGVHPTADVLADGPE